MSFGGPGADSSGWLFTLYATLGVFDVELFGLCSLMLGSRVLGFDEVDFSVVCSFSRGAVVVEVFPRWVFVGEGRV